MTDWKFLMSDIWDKSTTQCHDTNNRKKTYMEIRGNHLMADIPPLCFLPTPPLSLSVSTPFSPHLPILC